MPETPSNWVTYENAALFTDLYQLTMLQAYHRQGMNEAATFDLFVRRLGKRNYLVACGLDTCLEYLERLRFTEDSLGYLASLGRFDEGFLNYLAGFRFTGHVAAVREGTPVFADEPILEVTAPIGEAQLVETFLLNQITFQTNAATKASRLRIAAGDRVVADFGMRRMHGADAPLKGARAFYVGGVDSTSNVLAGRFYGLPVSGTMAHSYVEAHEVELEAFRSFAEIYSDTILLVDTYDTMEGVRKVVELAREMGEAFSVRGIRLDSGDLGALAVQARAVLDDAGLSSVRIIASGSLDEHRLAGLIASGAPIDGFGVGTKLGTISDQPYLDSAYKLSSYAGTPRMKLSSEKSSIPGRKQTYRQYDGDTAERDVIAVHDESCEGEPMLEPVMTDGRRAGGSRRTLEEIRDHARRSIMHLPDRLRSIDEARPPYEVRLSEGLQRRIEETRAQLAGSRS